MKQLPIIHKERFEAWLFSQPKDRKFDFFDINGCLLCMFFKETTNLQNPSVGGVTYGEEGSLDNSEPIPPFVRETLLERKECTLGEMQEAYTKLFLNDSPEQIDQPQTQQNETTR